MGGNFGCAFMTISGIVMALATCLLAVVAIF